MNATNVQIESAILNLEPTVTLGQPIAASELKDIIRPFMRMHPEIFWFSNKYVYEETTGTIQFKYNFTKEKVHLFSGEIEKVIKRDFQVDYVRGLSELGRLVYVYKWIAKRTNYNEYSSYNQTIYSVLINRNSVCTGYAKAAQYLLSRVGINSRLLFGKLNCDNTDAGRHAWNIVQIDGIWYHVDFCLANISLCNLINNDERPNVKDSVLWNYFGVSTRKMLTNRTIEDIESIPDCNLSLIDIPDVTLNMPTERLVCCKSDSGSSSMVYLDSFNKNVVVKVPRDNQCNMIEHEASILGYLSGCKHIVKFVSATDKELVIEQLTPWGELLNSSYYNLTDSGLQTIIYQLILGLIECKQNGICYSDIHYNNVFVSSEGVYKWGDFGLAFSTRTWDYLPMSMFEGDIPKGSQWFMAPETYRSGIFNESSAIYSVSMMAYFVMNDMRPPFWLGNDYQAKALSMRLEGLEIPRPANVNRYQSMWKLVSRNLAYESSKRAQTFNEFLCLLQKESDIEIDDIVDFDVTSSNDYVDNCSIDEFARTAAFPGMMHASCDEISSVDYIDDCSIDTFASSAALPPEYDIEPNSCSAPISTTIGEDSFRPSQYPNQFEGYMTNERETYNGRQPPKMERAFFLTRLIKKLVESFKASRNNSELKNLDRATLINACVYAPAQIKANKSFIINVYLYKLEETDDVDSKMKEIDINASKKEYKPLDLPINYGDKLTVQLRMSDGVSIDKELKSVVWHNHYTNCSFMARLTDESIRDVHGTAYVYANGIPAGELLFTIDVVEAQERKLYAKVESHRYSRVFISYSHFDESQVKGFAECCKAIGTDYFFDRHTLHAGDVFKDKILNYIHNADLFVLCWSKNAAQSEWVQIEREYALSLIKSGEVNLSIYPLSLKPEAPLPLDMVDKYNFGEL